MTGRNEMEPIVAIEFPLNSSVYHHRISKSNHMKNRSKLINLQFGNPISEFTRLSQPTTD